MLLDNLALFVRIVEKKGMGAAGKEFGLSPASVSERLATLEEHYGARLLNRTTRSISLTDEGRQLLDGARRILSEAADLETCIKHGVERVSGPIYITTPIDLGRTEVVPLINEFLETYPDVKIDILLNDGYVDIVGLGIDFALRLGRLNDSSLRTKSLGLNQSYVCASPAYIEKYGEPKTPYELANHNCITRRLGNQLEESWRFVIDGDEHSFVVHGDRTSNSGNLVKRWCMEGRGLAKMSWWDLHDELDAGRVVKLLEDYLPPPRPLQIVYPTNRNQPRRVRLFIDFMADWFTKNGPRP